MQYLGGKLSAAQLQVAGWVGSVRRSLQGALELVWGPAEGNQDGEEEEDKGDEEEEEEERGDGGGRFQRTMSPLRSFARRSRRSLRRFSVRSRQSLQRRGTESCPAQVNSYCVNSEDKDTDALIDNEPDQHNEAGEQTAEADSPTPIPELVPEVPTEYADTTDFHRVEEPAPFPETTVPLLDTSAQRSKADVGKRRIRTRPSRLRRTGSTSKESPDWRTRDSTDEKEASSKKTESDSEEEQPKAKIVRSPLSASQRVPMFPGLSPAALIAQIKKRTGGGGTGGGEETEEDKRREEKERQNDKAATPPAQPTRSPRSPAHLAGAARVLPPIGGTDGGSGSSPAWLKELKSKKRLSQYDSEA